MENPGMRYASSPAGGVGVAGMNNDHSHHRDGIISGGPKSNDPGHQHQQDFCWKNVHSSSTDKTLAMQRHPAGDDKKSIDSKLNATLTAAHQSYNAGRYKDAQVLCESVYRQGAYRTDNLLLLGAVHFQLRNFSECILYNQQCIRIDPNFAEAYSNLGNALKELGDVAGAVQFYLKAVRLKPRFCDAYNNLASAYMQLGQTQEAIETYQMALVLNRGLVDAHSNLGNLYKAQGMLPEAKRCYLEAIRIKPDFSIAWSNLAGIFKEEGNLTTAVAYYREAIRLCPEFADAHSNLGNVLKERGLIPDAMQCYQTAIKLRPDFAIAFGNLASCYYESGCMELAIRTFRYAIQLEPNFPDAYNNLGNALRESGHLEEAINCYRTTLRLKADHPHAYNNLGNAMKDKGLIKEAIHCYVTAVRLMPKFAAVHSNLGSVLKEQGKLDHALAHYHEAISIDPTFADAYSNMGNAYKDSGRLEDAIKCYSAAINIKPTFADAFSNLASAYKEGGNVLQAITCYRKALTLRPSFPDAFANLVHSLVFVCDWSNRDKDFAALKETLADQMASDNVLPSVQPFHAMAYPLSLAEMQQISRKYAQRVKMNVALLEMPSFRFHRKPKEARVRIGYMSSDLGNHPLSHLMQSVFGMHDRSRFEVKCYALSPEDSSVWRKKIESESEHFCEVSGLQNGEVARLIHTDGIDILINLNGYTKGARNEIFALQPAPVQVSYLGFCGTLGADYMQYMIADETVVPPESRKYYTEKMVYMPHSYFVNDHKQSARYVLDGTQLPTRVHYGVPEDRFVLCNFNQLYKMDPAIFSTWMSVLRRVPNAVLWLLRFPPAGEANIRKEARNRGVRDEQLHFTDVAPKEEHIKRGYLADLFLDTPSCNAHTTGCDILWSGTPMLTMAGSKMATRVAPSLLKAAGADELIVGSFEEYEEMAVTLATDPERLFQIRIKLEEGRHTCPLFDTQRWVRNMEAGLMMAHERFQAGLPPEDIRIVDDGADSEQPLTQHRQPQQDQAFPVVAVATAGPCAVSSTDAGSSDGLDPVRPSAGGVASVDNETTQQARPDLQQRGRPSASRADDAPSASSPAESQADRSISELVTSGPAVRPDRLDGNAEPAMSASTGAASDTTFHSGPLNPATLPPGESGLVGQVEIGNATTSQATSEPRSTSSDGSGGHFDDRSAPTGSLGRAGSRDAVITTGTILVAAEDAMKSGSRSPKSPQSRTVTRKTRLSVDGNVAGTGDDDRACRRAVEGEEDGHEERRTRRKKRGIEEAG